MKDRKFLFEEDSVWHALAVMALPAIASQLITLVYNIADTWFVGRTNNPYMVATLATMLSNLAVLLYFIIVYQKASRETILRAYFKGEKPSKKSLSAIFGVGIPAATGIFLFDLCNIVINRLAASYGDRQLVFNIPLLFVLSHFFGMSGVVWTQAIADLFTAVVSYIIYADIRKQEGWGRSQTEAN